ncbi:YARHG domain-containing protein [Flavobacterium sp. AC]|uniref:YARHG domain-containing protein n=1 Tax=Flavobacterium azizsancarii TaxID=2961580 RepID=A0ABT4W6R1_9FLAO|nr:YARHG domain-containing protein [Flavobacterium azizsancarii]MDA6068241.1 YARHG domain-containing protein [Flavobacterium azizsancarii]
MRQLQIVLAILVFSSTAQAQLIKNCATCLSKNIKPEQIENLSIDELRFLSNDLYARKGYRFKTGDIDSYYSNMNWYRSLDNNDKIVLITIEKQNIQMFQQKIAALKAERDKLINELKAFKSFVLSNDKTILKNRYSFSTQNEQYKNITEALTKINLEDMNWSKNRGLYSVTIDNGDYVMAYELKIDKNNITIQYSSRGGTEIGESIYPSEFSDEYSFWWEFEWQKDKLKFIKMNVAG